MIEFSTLYPRVLRHAPGCPIMTVLATLREGAIEFCERTQVWKRDVSYIKLAKNVRHFELSPPDDSEVITVSSVKYDGVTIDPQSTEWLDRWVADWQNKSGNQPEYYFITLQDDIMRVNIYPKPSETLSEFITCKLVLRPTVDSLGMDSEIFARYRSILVAGALRELLSINGKSWTDHKLAKKFHNQFESGVSLGSSDSLRSFTNTNLVVQPVSIM